MFLLLLASSAGVVVVGPHILRTVGRGIVLVAKLRVLRKAELGATKAGEEDDDTIDDPTLEGAQRRKRAEEPDEQAESHSVRIRRNEGMVKLHFFGLDCRMNDKYCSDRMEAANARTTHKHATSNTLMLGTIAEAVRTLLDRPRKKKSAIVVHARPFERRGEARAFQNQSARNQKEAHGSSLKRV